MEEVPGDRGKGHRPSISGLKRDFLTGEELGAFELEKLLDRALELNASALILVHNHPSGDPTPSEADIAMTLQIRDAAEALSLQLHDHLIIGKSREVSLRSDGYI